MKTQDEVSEKLQGLTSEQLAKVSDFIDGLEERDDARAWMSVSESSLARVWDNEEDAVYDAL